MYRHILFIIFFGFIFVVAFVWDVLAVAHRNHPEEFVTPGNM
jgi:hypothetical protein